MLALLSCFLQSIASILLILYLRDIENKELGF